MRKLEPQSISYHGWQIQVVQHQVNFSFQCYPPKLAEFCDDALEYSSFAAALAAARHFIDRELAILALFDRISEWLEAGKISEDEYWNLTSFD